MVGYRKSLEYEPSSLLAKLPPHRSSLVDGDGVADGVERGGLRPGAVVDGADAPQAGGAFRVQIVELGDRAVLDQEAQRRLRPEPERERQCHLDGAAVGDGDD